MTGARVARFGRSRILLGLGVLITIVVGFFTYFQNSQQELGHARLLSILSFRKLYYYSNKNRPVALEYPFNGISQFFLPLKSRKLKI